MVHASLRAVGEVLGGPDELIAGILAAVGDAGTMMMYIGSPSPLDDVGRGFYGADDEAFILENCPPFDPLRARANREFGALAELFRGHPQIRCSANAGARMAAVGARADELTRDHARDYGLGVGSPLERLCRVGGKVLLLGADLDNVTLLHYAEAVAPIASKRIVRVRVPVMQDGVRVWVEAEEFDSCHGIVDWPDRWFARITEDFLAEGRGRSGPIGGAHSHLIDARALVAFAVPRMVAAAGAAGR
jgi:aminoglycoside 3-N-acetyltransferase